MNKFFFLWIALISDLALARVHVITERVVPANQDFCDAGLSQFSRILRTLGYCFDYQELKTILPKSFQMHSSWLGSFEWGPTTSQIINHSDRLLEYLKTKERNCQMTKITSFELLNPASLDDLIQCIDQQSHSLVLIHPGHFNHYFGIQIPALHYVIPVNYREVGNKIISISVMEVDGTIKEYDTHLFKTWWQQWFLDLNDWKLITLKWIFSEFFNAQITSEPYLKGGTLFIVHTDID